ncbi:antibiotic biosynthesis monooxygenase family protein [Burkholderia ubonensis MSMB22]|nr:antibiotic biosynthesis monooxygenase family protein [Burkholderia ubonensis MSMB22]
MMEIAVVALIVARPGEEEKLRAVLEGIVEPPRNEPGALQYDLHRDLKEPAGSCSSSIGRARRHWLRMRVPRTFAPIARPPRTG